MSKKSLIDQVTQKPGPKSVLHNHYDISTPNELHQMDLMFLPWDENYKYALCVVDTASRYKQAQPMQSKEAVEILENLKYLYGDASLKTTARTRKQKVEVKDELLKKPQKIQVDRGSEFNNGIIINWCKTNGIKLIFNEPSNHVPMVENFNKQLARLIFKDQAAKELQTGKENVKWVDKLNNYVDILNNRKTRMIGMKPVDAIKLDYVQQPENNFSKVDMEKFHRIGTKVRRLLNNDEVQDYITKKIKTERKRATDATFSLNTYTVESLHRARDELIMHKIRDNETGTLYPHMYTYWQLIKI